LRRPVGFGVADHVAGRVVGEVGRVVHRRDAVPPIRQSRLPEGVSHFMGGVASVWSMVLGCFGFCHNNHDPSRRGRHLKLLSVKVLRRRMEPPVGVISYKSQIWCRKVLCGNGLRRKSFRVSRTDVKWLWCKGLWLGAESFARWGGCESAGRIAVL
jgi:hypothetical protein